MLSERHAAAAARPDDRPRPVRRGLGRAARRCPASSRRRASGHGSTTETFAAITLDIDTRRWAGVPFYLRTGKRLGRRVTEVAVVFKRAPHLPFSATATEELDPERPGDPGPARRGHDPAVRRRRCPAPRWRSATSTWTSPTAARSPRPVPEAYERLILDVLLGDPPLFPRHEEVELSWQILDPILELLGRRKGHRPEQYAVRHLGPGVRRRDAAPATAAPGGDHDDRAHRHQLASAIAAAFVRARTKAGSPRDGHGDDADHRRRRGRRRGRDERGPRRPPTSTRRGSLGVILGDAPRRRRRATPRSASAGGWTRRDRADPARGRGGQAPRVGRAAAAAARLPRRHLVAARPAGRPRRRPARRARAAPDHRRRRRHPRQAARAMHAQCASYAPGNTDLAWTRLTPWRALLAAALDQHPLKVTVGVGHRRADQPERRPARRLARRPAQGARSTRRELRRARASPRCVLETKRGADPHHAAPTASWPRSPRPASPTGRSR